MTYRSKLSSMPLHNWLCKPVSRIVKPSSHLSRFRKYSPSLPSDRERGRFYGGKKVLGKEEGPRER